MQFDGQLFVSTANLGRGNNSEVTGAQIWASPTGDSGTFYNLVHDGMDGVAIYVFGMKMPKNYGIRSFSILNDTLYIGTATMLNIPALSTDPAGGRRVGCEIWRMIP